MLKNNWLTSEEDYEYNQYVVLSYCQKIEEQFNQHKLYPSMSDLILNIELVSDFINNKKRIDDSKVELKEIDFINNKLVYKSSFQNDKIDQIYNLAEFSFTEFKKVLKIGSAKYRSIFDDIKIHELGIKNPNVVNGYIIFDKENEFEVFDFQYIKFFDKESFCGINLKSKEIILKNDNINYKIIYNNLRKTTSNNIFLVLANPSIPFVESNLPVLKRKFLSFFTENILYF